MPDLFLMVIIGLTLAVLLAASYSDIRIREVPDWLSYGFLFAALGIRAIFSFGSGWEIILSGILGFAVFFLLSLFFYYTNQWGGGDSKILMGMGAAIGIAFPFSASSWNLLWFFLSLLFLGAVYGLLWMVYIAVRKGSPFIAEMKKTLLMHKKAQFGVGTLSALLAATGFIVPVMWLAALFAVAVLYLLLFVTTVEKVCFVARISPSKLTEGDWLAEDVVVDGKLFMPRKTLEGDDLSKLTQLARQGKISYVTVKEGIPFLPSFLLAYAFINFGAFNFMGLFSFI
ncbi:MAG: A24 family peptidase [Nanoarchaeota archaeon]